jgi:hypothetical protein
MNTTEQELDVEAEFQRGNLVMKFIQAAFLMFHKQLLSCYETSNSVKVNFYLKRNTMKPVWSDTWVFRHPVTSDKNFRSQNISLTFFVKKSWVFRNLSLPTSDTVFQSQCYLLHWMNPVLSASLICSLSNSVVNWHYVLWAVPLAATATNCGYYRITILSSVSGDGVKVQLLHSGYFWYSSAHITLRSTTLLPVLS